MLDQVSPRPEEVTSSFAGKNPDRNRSEEFLPGTHTSPAAVVTAEHSIECSLCVFLSHQLTSGGLF